MAKPRGQEALGSCPQLRPKQVEALLRAALPAKRIILLVGGPGVGKTSIPRQISAELGYKNVITDHPVYGDPTDGKGIPWIVQQYGMRELMLAMSMFLDKDGDVFSAKDRAEIKQTLRKAFKSMVGQEFDARAQYNPAGTLADVMSAKELTTWIIDDFGQAPSSVQAAYMPALLDRTINGHQIPDCVSIVATTNRRTDKAGVQGLLEPVKGRFDTIFELATNVDDSAEYFLKLAVREPELEDACIEMVGFLHMAGARLLNAFEPTNDMRNSPTPRTWEHVLRWCALFNTLKIGRDVELATLQGAVGEGAAHEYEGYRRIRHSMPSIDGIFLNPDKERIPCDELSAMYATTMELAFRSTPQNFDRVVKYAVRMLDHRCSEHQIGLAEFVSLLVTYIHRHKKEVQEIPAWTRLAAHRMSGGGTVIDLIKG